MLQNTNVLEKKTFMTDDTSTLYLNHSSTYHRANLCYRNMYCNSDVNRVI